MPVDFKIFEDPVLVYIRYFDHVEPSDIRNALTAFAAQAPEFAHQPHFFDFSGVTSYDIDYPEFFRLIGQLVDVYPHTSGELLSIFYGPEGPAAELAEILRKPFDGNSAFLIRQARSREEAFDILGSTRADLAGHMEAHA